MAVRLPLRILLVEDNAVNQKVALRMLERLGYRADVAANGLEALEAFDRQRYDVVLMDVQMPEMDGLEATRRLRDLWPSDVQPRVIAMTANALKGDRELCLAAGMDDYISKPVRITELVRVLAEGHEHAEAAETAAPAPERTLDLARLAELRELDTEGEPRVTDDLLETYLRHAPRNIDAMRKAVSANDLDALSLVAHRFKGSSGNMGAEHMAELCSGVERAANESRMDDAAQMLESIETHLPVLRDAFAAWRRRE